MKLFLIALNFHHFKCNWFHHLVNHLCYQKFHHRYLTWFWIRSWCWVTTFFDSYSAVPAKSFFSLTSFALELFDGILCNLFDFCYFLIFNKALLPHFPAHKRLINVSSQGVDCIRETGSLSDHTKIRLFLYLVRWDGKLLYK